MSETAKILDLDEHRRKRERERNAELLSTPLAPFYLWQAAMIAILKSVERR